MKDNLGEQIMKKLLGLLAKMCSYLKDNNDEDKNAKGTKKCVIKNKFQDYKNFLKASQILNKMKYFKKKKLI